MVVSSIGRTFPPAFFRLSPLLGHVRKVVGDFGKKVVLVVSTGCEKARKNVCVTDHHDMTLAVKVALNSNTTTEPIGVVIRTHNLELLCLSLTGLTGVFVVISLG